MMDHTDSRLFLTGMLRSGTTLLDKVLNSHPDVTVASQPMFQVFIAAKQKYHDEKGLSGLPLSPGFLDDPALRDGFQRFLSSVVFDDRDIAQLQTTIAETNRRWSPEISSDKLRGLQAGSFFDLFAQCLSVVRDVYGSKHTRWTGVKEVICEEFLPFLLSRGVKAILIYRDPRAVICSATTGNHEYFVGKVRPILLDIRNWRKSIAYLIMLSDHPDFMAVRYEELVLQPQPVLERITRFLGVADFEPDLDLSQLTDQGGRAWKANSSSGSDRNAGSAYIQGWRKLLSSEQVRFIDACCYPELIFLGYQPAASWNPDSICSYKDRSGEMRNEYALDHHLTKANQWAEIERMRLLQTAAPLDEDTVRRFFLDVKVRQTLKAALPPGLPPA